MNDFRELIRTKGLDAAAAERDRIQASVLGEAGLTIELFHELDNRLRAIDNDYREACRSALSMARANGSFNSAKTALTPPHADETHNEWILRQLKSAGGRVYGPDLYDEWENAGGSRRSIQTTVSVLIGTGRVRKGPRETRGRRWGSWLELRQ